MVQEQIQLVGELRLEQEIQVKFFIGHKVTIKILFTTPLKYRPVKKVLVYKRLLVLCL